MMHSLLVCVSLVAVIATHEAGHAIAARLLGYRPRVVRYGLGIAWGDEATAPPPHRVYVSAAGPLASLLLVPILWRVGLPLMAAGSLEMCVWNLLPFRHSDGSHIRAALRGGKA